MNSVETNFPKNNYESSQTSNTNTSSNNEAPANYRDVVKTILTGRNSEKISSTDIENTMVQTMSGLITFAIVSVVSCVLCALLAPLTATISIATITGLLLTSAIIFGIKCRQARLEAEARENQTTSSEIPEEPTIEDSSEPIPEAEDVSTVTPEEERKQIEEQLSQIIKEIKKSNKVIQKVEELYKKLPQPALNAMCVDNMDYYFKNTQYGLGNRITKLPYYELKNEKSVFIAAKKIKIGKKEIDVEGAITWGDILHNEKRKYYAYNDEKHEFEEKNIDGFLIYTDPYTSNDSGERKGQINIEKIRNIGKKYKISDNPTINLDNNQYASLADVSSSGFYQELILMELEQLTSEQVDETVKSLQETTKLQSLDILKKWNSQLAIINQISENFLENNGSFLYPIDSILCDIHNQCSNIERQIENQQRLINNLKLYLEKTNPQNEHIEHLKEMWEANKEFLDAVEEKQWKFGEDKISLKEVIKDSIQWIKQRIEEQEPEYIPGLRKPKNEPPTQDESIGDNATSSYNKDLTENKGTENSDPVVAVESSPADPQENTTE